MTLTDAMVEFVVTARPPEAALRQADARLDRWTTALRRGGTTVEDAIPVARPPR